MDASLFERVDEVKDKLQAWWDGAEMRTPCLLMTTPDLSAPPVPETDDLDQYWWDVDWGIEYALRRINSQKYLGVALPYHWPD